MCLGLVAGLDFAHHYYFHQTVNHLVMIVVAAVVLKTVPMQFYSRVLR